jgi:ABC-2 type transport system ATP-binding protein
VDFTALGQILDRPVEALSKGQKQRLSLARVLINDPAVLILDEPAAGLDPRARVQLRDLTRALADQGKAIFISSHILTELSEICDAVTIIEAGKLCASKSIRALQKQVDAGQRIAVALHKPTLDEKEALVRFLLETPGVMRSEMSKRGAVFSYEGASSFRAEILKRLITNDFPVTEFYSATSDLEDAFLTLTKGKVT